MSYKLVVDRARDGDEAWLAWRRKIVTASESAHLMGKVKGPWAKTEEGLAGEKRAASTISPSPLMLAGQFWEPSILAYLSKVAGLELQPSSGLYVSERYPWMGATPDALVLGPGWPETGLSDWLVVQYRLELFKGPEAVQALHEALAGVGYRALVETKNQESKRRSKWNKPQGGPDYYENQAAHQLAVLDDYGLNLLTAKVDANELYVHVVERDQMYEELLASVCQDFSEKYLTVA